MTISITSSLTGLGFSLLRHERSRHQQVSIYDDPLQTLNIYILDHNVPNSRHDDQFVALFFSIGGKSRVLITKMLC